MTEGVQFKPITYRAEKILNEVIRRRDLTKISKIKFLCACLGPGKENPNYALREKIKECLKQLGHDSFFPEELDQNELLLLLGKTGLTREQDILIKDKNLLNEIIIHQSDLIFILCEGTGAFIELGKFGKIVPHKIYLLVQEDKYNQNSQFGLEVKDLNKVNPNCLITYKDAEELSERIGDCVSKELRKKLRSETYEKPKF